MQSPTRERVRAVLDQVTAAADKMGSEAAVAVTDRAGRLTGALRGERTSWVAMEVAIKKAAAAAAFGVPTEHLARTAEDDLVARAAGSVQDILVVPGGFPLLEGNEVVGGVGIAAGHYSRDQEIGAKAFST